ncbi:response regulator [Clostridium estertheticum]|uniref:response regulator n=1 Tax=Clostridium estertheticum TaxID=238834 RepID=UPI0013E92C1C|nr:response regulator [Clostridium estertheticum]MBZ9688533.1 response regulator [Clostridium estertheticum]
MKVILVDDEKSMLLIMKKMISKVPEIEIAGAFQSSAQAYKFIKENRVDIAFIDIKMPEESGLDLARRIVSEFERIDIVFLTSHKEYALEAFDVHAVDYIVKPVSQERLEHTIKRIKERLIFPLPYSYGGASVKLSVYCLGGLDIRGVDGGSVKLTSSKSLELLAYLLLNKGEFVSKWRVIEDVFGEMSPHNAETYLNTTIYKLRKALLHHEMKSAVISVNESYRIDIKDIYIDFIDFDNRVNALCIINESNLEDAIKTEKLFVGQLFGDKGYHWSLPEKERLSEVHWDFVKKLGNYLLKNNSLTISLQIFKKMAIKNELDEEVNCLLMRVYAAKRDRISLIKQYNRYTKVLQRELEVTPASNTAKLYAELRKSLE